jgi:hypothetical protein
MHPDFSGLNWGKLSRVRRMAVGASLLSSARFQSSFACIIPIAQLSGAAAKTSPAPDKGPAAR